MKSGYSTLNPSQQTNSEGSCKKKVQSRVPLPPHLVYFCRGNPCGYPDLWLLLDTIAFGQAQDLPLRLR